MRFALESLDRWTPERRFEVDRDRIRAYAEATNETARAFLAGDEAPPVFAVVPVWETLHEAVRAVVPEEARPRVVHGEQDLFLRAPLWPGLELIARSAVVGVHTKPSGTTVVIKAETRDGDGKLVNEQFATEFYRGVEAEQGGGATAPDHRAPEGLAGTEPVATVAHRVDDDQTFRYADASGDRFEIHLDDDFARAAGLPGIIVHGLCVMAFTGRAVLESANGEPPARLRRLAVRFSRPVRPGETLATSVWSLGDGAYAFETANGEGELVIKDGRAELDGAR